jgi:protein SCO1/2
MKTFTHIALILIVGVGLGLAIRSLKQSRKPAGPGPDDVVFTNDGIDSDLVIDEADVENSDPSHPPEGEQWLSRFELTERSGKTVTSDQLLGQPYLVSFFFTTCPSICVQQNQKLQELQKEFEDQGVRFVAISCDPETDTPERLREYAARFGADEEQWLFMTGDLTYIRRVGAEVFQLPVDQKFHTERFVLVDAEGKIEGYYNWPEPRQFEKLKEKVSEMLAGNKDA